MEHRSHGLARRWAFSSSRVAITVVVAVGCGGGAADVAATDPDASALEDASAPADANEASSMDAGVDSGSEASTDATTDPDVAPQCVDLDGDGYGVGPACLGLDCNDQNPLLNPKMAELADDGLDNDCAGGDLVAATGPGKYVDIKSASCSDTDVARGSKATPYCTIAKAVLDAYQNPPADPAGAAIFVAQGEYPHVLSWPKSMRIYGGYESTNWTYDPIAHPTIIGNTSHLDDLDGAACRASMTGCTAMCVCVDWESWISVNTTASSVIQGMIVQGGARLGAPLRAASVNSSGRVVFADMRMTAGLGIQNVGLWIDRTATDVWLIRTKLDAGVPVGTGASASAFAVVNHGAATIWGSTISSGPGVKDSFAVAVQNWGTMRMANTVLNPGDQGGAADYSYGLRNLTTTYLDNTTSLGTAYAVNNVIFGGAGVKGSRAVFSNSPLTIANNVIGDRTSTPLDWALRPTEDAIAVDVGFASKTKMHNNAIYSLVYTNEPSPPNALANRHLLIHSQMTSTIIDDVPTINACAWTGCQTASANSVATAPGFVDVASDFHLVPTSALIGKGTPTGPFISGGLGHMDVDDDLRPKGASWDMGVDERP